MSQLNNFIEERRWRSSFKRLCTWRQSWRIMLCAWQHICSVILLSLPVDQTPTPMIIFFGFLVAMLQATLFLLGHIWENQYQSLRPIVTCSYSGSIFEELYLYWNLKSLLFSKSLHAHTYCFQTFFSIFFCIIYSLYCIIE